MALMAQDKNLFAASKRLWMRILRAAIRSSATAESTDGPSSSSSSWEFIFLR